MTSHEHQSGDEPWHDLPEGLVAHLELEAVLNAPVRNAALDRAIVALDAVPVEVIDLGSGIGADAVALAERFPAATVHAVDVSTELLDRVASTASAACVTDRIERRQIDLNDDWPAYFPQPADLVWASLTLHHLADPGEALQRVFTALRPGGALVLTELSGEEILSPGNLDTARPSWWDRMEHAFTAHDRRPTVDWSRLLTQAGLTAWPRHEYEFVVRADTVDGSRFLDMQLRSRRARLDGHLPREDLTALDAAIQAVENGMSQVSFRSGRTVWIATRPTLSALAVQGTPPVRIGAAAEGADAHPSETADGLVADVAVVGGGSAGLAAAIVLARSRRNVVVIDAGEPRNAPAEAAHNILGNEGIPPLDLLAKGRAEAEAYGVRLIPGPATGVSGTIDDFSVDVDDGAQRVRARRIILATGLIDDLPDIPGVVSGWGHTVLHCPFCHGWEVRDRQIAIITRDEVAIHHAMLFSQLSAHVTVFLHDAVQPSQEQRDQLAALNVAVVRPRVERLLMEGTQVRSVQVEGGRIFETDAVVVAPRFNTRTKLYEMLGGTAEQTPFGIQIPADPRGMTEVPGVWSAGNASQPMAMIVASAASGVTTGTAVHGELRVAELNQSLAAPHRPTRD